MSGILCLIFLSGCSSLQEAINRTIAEITFAEEEASGGMSDSEWAQVTAFQAQIAFTFVFNAGGFWIGEGEYKPGEYTKFEWISDEEDPVVMEKAFLIELDDGKQWWRVGWTHEGETWIFESLLDPQIDQMVRLRARDPEGNIDDVPLEGQSIYVPPNILNEDNLDRPSKARERLETPAGTFQTDHVVFDSGDDIIIEWWMANNVPGGVVKYLLRSEEEGLVWESTLLEYGKKAATELDSF